MLLLACFQLMDMWRVLERRWVGSLWFALHWETPLKCFQLFWEVRGWHLTRSIVDFLKRKLKKLLPGPGDVGGFENESKMCKASALPNCSCARANFPDCELNISNVFVFRCKLTSAKFWECLLAVVFLIFLVNCLNLSYFSQIVTKISWSIESKLNQNGEQESKVHTYCDTGRWKTMLGGIARWSSKWLEWLLPLERPVEQKWLAKLPTEVLPLAGSMTHLHSGARVCSRLYWVQNMLANGYKVVWHLGPEESGEVAAILSS